MSDAPTKVVIDCSKAGPPDPESAEEFRQAAFAQLEKGNLEKAAALLREGKDLLAASQESAETVVSLTDAEVKQRARDEAEHLDQAREAKVGAIRAALAATDHWVVRALEEGGEVSKPRTAHRRKLRDLLAKAASAKTHKDLDAIDIPAPPKS